jgi:hypothetical protein
MEEMVLINLNIGKINKNLNIKKREIIINKFIEKFPKTKLHNIIQINKHYANKNFDKKIELDENSNDIKLDNSIYNYFLMQN